MVGQGLIVTPLICPLALLPRSSSNMARRSGNFVSRPQTILHLQRRSPWVWSMPQPRIVSHIISRLAGGMTQSDFSAADKDVEVAQGFRGRLRQRVAPSSEHDRRLPRCWCNQVDLAAHQHVHLAGRIVRLATMLPFSQFLTLITLLKRIVAHRTVN